MNYGFYITHELPEFGLKPAVIGWAGTEQMARQFIAGLSDQKNIKVVPV